MESRDTGIYNNALLIERQFQISAENSYASIGIGPEILPETLKGLRASSNISRKFRGCEGHYDSRTILKMLRVCSRSHAYRDNLAAENLKITWRESKNSKSHSATGRHASVGLGNCDFPYMHDFCYTLLPTQGKSIV